MPSTFPGIVDDSDDPILPPWYISGWTAQGQQNIAAPSTPFPQSALPSNLTFCEIIGNYNDGNGNQMGGYLTFEQSDDLLIQDPSGKYFRVPKRMVGNIPVNNMMAWNAEGSGKVYLQFGQLDVILMATDQPNASSVTILQYYYQTQEAGFVQPTTWVYHVKEYLGIGSRRFDISVPSANSGTAVDINTLIIPTTIEPNHDWNRGI